MNMSTFLRKLKQEWGVKKTEQGSVYNFGLGADIAL